MRLDIWVKAVVELIGDDAREDCGGRVTACVEMKMEKETIAAEGCMSDYGCSSAYQGLCGLRYKM